MLQPELAEIIATKHNVSKKLAKDIIVSIFDEIKDKVRQGEEYHQWGFGKFVLSERVARMIHNVSSNRLEALPKKKSLKFLPSSEFNKSLN
jgi:nucleoid DNA-binding protein